jgi:hypothetical protein
MRGQEFENLPAVVRDYIVAVMKKMGYRRKVRQEVREELVAHFVDALKDCQDEQREERGKELIAEFGDVKLLGILLRRGKKRCRPMWQKIVVNSAITVGVLFLFIVGRVGYMAVGRASVTVDYVEWMNEEVRAGRNESLNAWPDYERAVKLIKDMPAIVEEVYDRKAGEPVDEEHWLAVERFLEENAGAFMAMKEGASKPYYWPRYKISSGTVERSELGLWPPGMLSQRVLELLMPTLSGYKKLAMRTSYLQIDLKLHKGDIEGAMDDCMMLQRFAAHMQGKGLLIEQLVGISLDAFAYEKTLRIISEYDVSTESLKKIQDDFEKSFNKDLVLNIDAEKAFWFDYVQRTFTDDGKGNGRVLIRGIPLAATDIKEGLKGFVSGYPDRREVMSGIERFFEEFAELSQKKPWQWDEPEPVVQNLKKVGSLGAFSTVARPGYEKVNRIVWRMKVARAGMLTILAILRYEKDCGHYPARLDELVAKGYLKELPEDAYGEGPLQYRKNGDGFLVYSLGSDLKDDGGRLGMKNGKPFEWADDGDWVFWPVKKDGI